MCKCKHRLIPIWQVSIVRIAKCEKCNAYFLITENVNKKIRLSWQEANSIMICFKAYTPLSEMEKENKK